MGMTVRMPIFTLQPPPDKKLMGNESSINTTFANKVKNPRAGTASREENTKFRAFRDSSLLGGESEPRRVVYM